MRAVLPETVEGRWREPQSIESTIRPFFAAHGSEPALLHHAPYRPSPVAEQCNPFPFGRTFFPLSHSFVEGRWREPQSIESTIRPFLLLMAPPRFLITPLTALRLSPNSPILLLSGARSLISARVARSFPKKNVLSAFEAHAVRTLNFPPPSLSRLRCLCHSRVAKPTQSLSCYLARSVSALSESSPPHTHTRFIGSCGARGEV